MQQASVAAVGARPARSLAVALLLGSAAVVGLVCVTRPSAPTAGAAVLPVFPLLEEAAALQVPVNTPRMRAGASVDRRSAIAAGFGVAAASVSAPAWAGDDGPPRKRFGKKEEAAKEEAPAAAAEGEAAPEAAKTEEKPKEVAAAPPPKKKGKADLSPYSKVDPNAFGGGRTMGKDFKAKNPEGILWKGPKAREPKLAKGKADAGVPLASAEDAMAIIQNSGARTFKDLAEGPQSGGGWYDHMEATRAQTERLYAEAAKRKAGM